MKKEKLLSGLFLLFMVCLGGVAGAYMARYVSKFEGGSVWKIFYNLISFYLAFFLSVIIHEGGHLVMGLVTGYTFISFRIGSLTIIKQDGKLRFKKFNIAGTGGQCLMMPPESREPEKVPFVLYHLGGGLFNFITAAVFLPIGLWVDQFYWKMPLVMLGAVSVFQGVMNLLPMKIQVATDGYNILDMLRNQSERIVLYKHLRINGLLYQGLTPAEIPAELFDFEGIENQGIYGGLDKLLKASLLIDRKDFVSAEKILKECLDEGKLISIYVNECKCELLFCKIMNGAPADEIDSLYDKELKIYIKASGKTQVSKKRLMYAYYLLYQKDMTAAEKEYEAAMKMRDTYPNAGELKSELSVIEFVKEQA